MEDFHAGPESCWRQVEKAITEKVGRVVCSIKDAGHVDQVIVALHSLAVSLFPVDSCSFLGSIDMQFREQVQSALVPDSDKRSQWQQIFYKGAAFPMLARVLLHDVALDWLACFPTSARVHVYDVFFTNGQFTEVIQALVPCLQGRGLGTHNLNAVCSNAERLLLLCLFENDGIHQMVIEFARDCQSEGSANESVRHIIFRVAQLITSIPDKARAGAPTSLSSPLFFKHITTQILAGAEEWDKNLDETAYFDKNKADSTILFVGEAFARICRRGFADVLLSELIPRILRGVQSLLQPSADMTVSETFESKPGLRFLLKIMEGVQDPHSVERLSEQLLNQLAAQSVRDAEAYWILWVLFNQIYKQKTSIRSMFREKFLLWKVFPICCSRWILHFAVFECAPSTSLAPKACNVHALMDTVQHLTTVWSKREFVQSAPIEQQAYITAALGLCLEKMSKEDLDATKDALQSILQGVSCRLQSPDHLVRKMASNVALAFSLIIDPKNPLYLDDSCHDEAIDWEFGLVNLGKGSLPMRNCTNEDMSRVKNCSSTIARKEFDDKGPSNNVMDNCKRLSECKLVDPDEIVDPASLITELAPYEDDNDIGNEDSDFSSDSSLQPYDLSDDDADLEIKFSQLVDVIGALRKPDDGKGVEKALDVAEKLVRATPDELKFVAGDLARTLVQVRCSDSTVEGEEESAEDKREKALVALIAMCPNESLNELNKLLYSPNLDVSQRILILDVMTDAAQELANTRTSKPKQHSRLLISSMSDQPWFVPRDIGPPGAGSWKEISTPGTPLNWSYSYERELPSKPSQVKKGKMRRWSLQSPKQENQVEWSLNKFPQYAAAFMLPAMQGYDKKRHGVDLLDRDFIVLGKLIYMLGVCMKCAAMHPEASVLASPLLDLLRSREVSYHKEAYVRRSVLFAASCILISLHPSFITSALTEGNADILKGLEWVRTWALNVAESDTDRECYTLAMTCVQLHSEMALQVSRALDSVENTSRASHTILPSNMVRHAIKIPHSIGI
ncbi:PREDICTED: telomere length regulation protein TEL2 homolog [Ipomoea nil]|uniref:telomere length regulation protein TEL2 homolog n=1 Tax=Ipomoea nil TaxID=35883 RepID=UPI000901AC94|nr:PREDICTED: telomere length regulation protein TEL2 homolog [Ipomoea nil]